jgi:hypothetical protein
MWRSDYWLRWTVEGPKTNYIVLCKLTSEGSNPDMNKNELYSFYSVYTYVII